MSTEETMSEAVKGAMSKLVLDKDKKQYTLDMDVLMTFIQELDVRGALGWSDRQRFVFERNPEGYMRRLFNDAGFNGVPVVIV